MGVQEFDPSTGNPSDRRTRRRSYRHPRNLRRRDRLQRKLLRQSDENGPILKYDSAGELLGTVDPYNGGEAQELAVDRSNDHLFVLYEYVVKEFEPDGALVMTFGQAEAVVYPASRGLRGSPSTKHNHHVYVTNSLVPSPRKVDVFAPVAPLTIPDVTTEAQPMSASTARPCTGRSSPTPHMAGAEIVSCEFKWGLERQRTHQHRALRPGASDQCGHRTSRRRSAA